MRDPGSTQAVVAAAAALAALGCAAPSNPARERRIAEATRGAEDDPAVQSRLAALEAALAREAGEVPIDSVQLRVADQSDGDHAVRVLSRIPVPNPWELRAERAARGAEAEASLALLEEVVLDRSAESCLLSIEAEAHRERSGLYEAYAERQRRLLEWNEEWRRSGAQNEGTATRFEIERRVKLAERMPDPAPVGPTGSAALPPIGAAEAPLDKSPELVRATIRRHPSVAARTASSEGYAALSERAAGERFPWFDFVDLAYEARQGRADELGGQVAVRVPFGSEARADADRFEALRRAELRDAERIVAEQVRESLVALAEIDRFEANAARWQELLELAQKAEGVAERWWQGRVTDPGDVAALFDRADDARSRVLEFRTRAGIAGCRLLATTGLPVTEWPRRP